MPPTSNHRQDDHAAQALITLCAGVFNMGAPSGASQAQSESAVTEMLQAFSDIDPHIHKAERQSQQITEALSQHSDGVTGLAQACDQALKPLLKTDSCRGRDQRHPRCAAMVHKAVTALENIASLFTMKPRWLQSRSSACTSGFNTRTGSVR